MPPSDNRKMSTKRSWVLAHFMPENDQSKAKCNMCNLALAYHGTTSNLTNHLKLKHPSLELRRDKLKAEKKENLKEVTQLCNYIGELLAKQGRFNEALKEHETELALCEALCDTIGCAVACRKMGECYCGLEDYDKALNLQKRHLSLAQSCQNLVEQQRALATIGRTYLFQSEAARNKELAEPSSIQAEKSFKKSLEICEKLRSEVQKEELMEMKARLYLNLGLVYDSRGDMTQCAEFMKRAITLSEQHKLHSDLYRCQYSLSSMYQRAGDLSQAQRYLDAAYRCAVKLKDKYLQNDVLLQKAVIYLQIGDYANSKHSLKKAYKLETSTPDEIQKMLKYFRAVSRIEEMCCNLNDIDDADVERKFMLYEKLGDVFADIGIYKQALDYYLKMQSAGEQLKKTKKEMIPIFVSLAQTFSDDKQYSTAVEYYKKELKCRDGDQEQMCRTWLNIADCQEQAGDGYQVISSSMVTAFDCARKAKHHRLQVHVLKSLIEVQKYYKQKTHRQQTESKLQALRDKYKISSDEELSDEDSQKSEPQEDELSIGDLTESDTSDEEIGRKPEVTMRTTVKRVTKAKRNEKGETPLHRACIEGNLQKVKRLIEQGHPVNPRDYCGWIPLHEAANHDFYEVVAYLLDHGGAVNDRGGVHCGGITPLIDAASCGNLEIMQLLIEKGANVLAKDDEGKTALDGLREWRGRCDSMDDALLSRYQEVEQLLSMKHKTQGGNVKGLNSVLGQRHGQQKVVGGSTGDMPNLNRPDSNKKKRSRNLRRTLSVSEEENSDEESPIRRYSSTQPLIPAVDSGRPVDKSSSNSATETYRQAMKSVGSSASRRHLPPTEGHGVKSYQDDREATALINADNFIDEDWLIDDMQPTKRRKIDMDGVFSRNTIRNKKDTVSVSDMDNTDDELVQTRLVKSKKVGLIDSDVEDDNSLDMDTCENVVSVERQENSLFTQEDEETLGKDGSVVNSEDSLSDVEMNFDPLPDLNHVKDVEWGSRVPVNISKDCDKTTSQSILGRKSLSTKPKQLRMTNFTVKPTDMGNQELSQTVSISQSVSDAFPSYSSLQPPGQTSQDPAGKRKTPVMRMKVRVNGKLLLVPISNADEDRNISWLCQEVTQRYFTLCGVRPLLTLSTQDGAFLSPDDSISLVLSADEEVIGTVEGWDVPPLPERYQQACKTLNTVTYRNVKTILQICEDNGVLDLSNLALRLAPITPVIKAVHGQPNLTELILTGNRIGDGGMEELVKACLTLPCLSRLSLSCNTITSSGVKHLAETLSRSGQQKVGLQTLVNLDLSHNPLGDSSYLHITAVINYLPCLTHFCLASCDFSAKFFQQPRLAFASALQKSSLQSLDVSYNKLGLAGIEFLNSVNQSGRIKMEISGNTANSHMTCVQALTNIPG